jgi:hypothetical protein
MLDLFAALLLIGAVFLLLNACKIAQAVWVGVGLVCYAAVLRSLFLRVEIKRLRE